MGASDSSSEDKEVVDSVSLDASFAFRGTRRTLGLRKAAGSPMQRRQQQPKQQISSVGADRHSARCTAQWYQACKLAACIVSSE
mmetsp:Transcript_109879/g.261986  ORF Transcript_109879/g.261986 Transcript_109879/m.261986 type:complete len:84 (+) Transcript_109879:390-641(+)